MTENIKNKVVIITGASSGLGEATALLLAKYGAKVVLAARRKERLEKLASQITSQGGEALVVVADVAVQSDVERIAQETLKRYDRIDVLINNAGIMPQATLDKLKVEEWDKMIDINVKRGTLWHRSSTPYHATATQRAHHQPIVGGRLARGSRSWYGV